MEIIELIIPTKEYKSKILDYKNEFEMNKDSMDGTAGLKDPISFDKWLLRIIDNSIEETVRNGCVQASTYLAVRLCDNKVLGMVDIRHRLNGNLLKFGGHIGYSVRKTERRKGYANKILSMALEKCKAINIDKVLVTCDKGNIESAKTIIRNGGILEDDVSKKKEITQRYWISL